MAKRTHRGIAYGNRKWLAPGHEAGVVPVTGRLQEIRKEIEELPFYGGKPSDAEAMAFAEGFGLTSNPNKDKLSIEQKKALADDKKSFDIAFNFASTVLIKEDELKSALRPLKRDEELLAAYEHKITKGNELAKIDDESRVKGACWSLNRIFGAPTNIRNFINRLHNEGVTTRRSNRKTMSETKLREIIRDFFGIKGIGGRKKSDTKIIR